MKKYSIPIVWQSYKRINVEADDLNSAIILALKQFLSEPDDNYVCDSFEIDGIITDETKENYDINFVLENI